MRFGFYLGKKAGGGLFSLPPEQMNAPFLTGSNFELTFAFSAAPTSDETITSYVGEITLAADTDFISPVAQQSNADRSNITFTELDGGDYIGRCWAVSSAGAGTPSNASAEETVTAITAPTHTGDTYSQTISEGDTTAIDGAAGFSGDAPLTFTLTGSSPVGLTINSTTGAIDASALADGSFTWTVTATNSVGSAVSGLYSLTVEVANLLVGAPTAGPTSTLGTPVQGGDVRIESVSGSRTTFYWLVALEDGATYRMSGDYIWRNSNGNAQLFRANADADLSGSTYGEFNLQVSGGGFTTPAPNTLADPNPFTVDFVKTGADASASVGFVCTVPHPFIAEFKNLSLVRIS